MFTRCIFKHILASENKKYAIKIRLWIEESEGSFLDIGKIWLVENIQKTGLITIADKEMKMAFCQAWQLIDKRNKREESPLVEKLL